MAVVKPPWESSPIEYLVCKKFPGITLASLLSVDRDPPGTVSLASLEHSKKIEAYRQSLAAMPESDLKSLAAETARKAAQEAQKAREAEERNYFFNRPGSAADFRYWASASYWTLDEATALSFGKNPRVVTWKAISALQKVSPFASEFTDRRELLSRAKFMGQLWDQTSPAVFLAWAERMRITVPDELIAEVKALGVQIADWKSLYEKERLRAGKLDEELESERSAHLATKREHVAYLKKVGDDQRHTHAEYDKAMQAGRDLLTLRDDRIAQLEKLVEELQSGPPIADKASETAARPLSTRERDSLLKLVIGMAMKGYAYDPKAGRSPTAKEIASDLALIGLPLDEDTVRKYLGEARQVLPSDEAEKNR